MKPLFPSLAVLLLVLSPLACGKKENAAGGASVSGKVMWEENLLPYGSVQFYSAEMVHTALIQSDGSYTFQQLPEGQVTVCIRTRGELYASSRDEEEFKKMRAQLKLPEGMSVEEFKRQMMAQGGAMKDMARMKKGGKPGMQRRPGKMLPQMPLVNGTPLLQAKGLPPEALMKIAELHDKYGEFGKSTLTYTVLAGAQIHDFILK